MIETPENLIKPEVELVGIDGNAFSIIGTVARELRRAGNDPDVIDAFHNEATSSDYEHVIQTALAYTA
jgi:hypothetical protein